MALTSEQEAQIAMQVAIEEARNNSVMAMEAKRNRLELVRLAKETLAENARNKPAEESSISAADITSFAEQLAAYIDA